jgi:glutamate N-acetyltransferase / amino-acid N-acetyltransferase
MKVGKGGVTSAKGFLANGLCCGIKKSGKPDLALIFSQMPAVTAAVFTKNSVKAAPLIVSQKNIRNGRAQAIVANSGNANCFTGDFGLIYAEQTAKLCSYLLQISADDVLVASTGIIGRPLPYIKIATAAETMVKGLSAEKGEAAARAIMTTDTFAKECALEVFIGGKKVTIGGCAKGSGMIAPNMATMLAFVTTDASITRPMLRKALAQACDRSFHSITVDGCMSTNDMLSVMANGMAANKKIIGPGKDYDLFCEALTAVCLDLAQKIVRDGEGASKYIEITVAGAKTESRARQMALAIANYNLVKTANYTDKPNWGRVAAAIGSLGIKGVDEQSMKIEFHCEKNNTEVYIKVTLSLGRAEAKAYTSNLTAEYVKINGEYT